ETLFGVSWSRLTELPVDQLRGLITCALLIAERRKTNPNVTTVSLSPQDVPAVNVRALLQRVNAIRRGKPIEYVVDFHDGAPTETIEVALEPAKSSTSRPPGRPRRPISSAEVRRMRERYPEATHQQLASRLQAETGHPVTKGLVRQRLREPAPKKSSGSKRGAEKP